MNGKIRNKKKWKNNGRCNFGTIFRSFFWSELAWFSWRPCHFHKGLHRTGSHIIELGLVFRVLILTLEEIAKEKRERAQKSESTKKGNWLKCLPENVAHTVAINVENSTVMAPVSLYAITCVRIINPIAKRPYAPDGIKSVILWFFDRIALG